MSNISKGIPRIHGDKLSSATITTPIIAQAIVKA